MVEAMVLMVAEEATVGMEEEEEVVQEGIMGEEVRSDIYVK